MTFLTHNLNVRKGDTLSCKYPKHGRLNILKRHKGVVEKLGVSDNGVYITIRDANGTCRSLSLDKVIEPAKVQLIVVSLEWGVCLCAGSPAEMPGFLRQQNVRIIIMCNDNSERDDYGDEYAWWDEYEASLDEQGGIYR